MAARRPVQQFFEPDYAESFSEGFDTADLFRAKARLKVLA